MNTTDLIARADFAHASLRMATAATWPGSRPSPVSTRNLTCGHFSPWCDRQGSDPTGTCVIDGVLEH